MKKTYEKPTLVKVGSLPLSTAGYEHTNGNGNGFFYSLHIT
jgi:Family of unknown function (DUF5972)